MDRISAGWANHFGKRFPALDDVCEFVFIIIAIVNSSFFCLHTGVISTTPQGDPSAWYKIFIFFYLARKSGAGHARADGWMAVACMTKFPGLSVFPGYPSAPGIPKP